MSSTSKRWPLLTVVFAVALLHSGANSLEAQGNCKVVLEAANKTLATATHTYSTINIAGKDQTVETIYLPGVVYTRMNGKWSSVKMTAEDLAAMHAPPARSDTATCKYLKDEPVNGEVAAVYNGHDITPSGTVDTVVWISKAKGLMLRQDMDIDAKGGGKSHMSLRYEYGNVKAPI